MRINETIVFGHVLSPVIAVLVNPIHLVAVDLGNHLTDASSILHHHSWLQIIVHVSPQAGLEHLTYAATPQRKVLCTFANSFFSRRSAAESAYCLGGQQTIDRIKQLWRCYALMDKAVDGCQYLVRNLQTGRQDQDRQGWFDASNFCRYSTTVHLRH